MPRSMKVSRTRIVKHRSVKTNLKLYFIRHRGTSPCRLNRYSPIDFEEFSVSEFSKHFIVSNYGFGIIVLVIGSVKLFLS